MEKKKRDLLVFGYGLSIILLFFTWRIAEKHGWGTVNNALSIGVLVMAFLTLFDSPILKEIYDRWMIGAGFIGRIISGVILAILFYGVFTPVGLIMRLLGKDLLDQCLEKESGTYWITRKNVGNENSSYKQQF